LAAFVFLRGFVAIGILSSAILFMFIQHNTGDPVCSFVVERPEVEDVRADRGVAVRAGDLRFIGLIHLPSGRFGGNNEGRPSCAQKLEADR
jgi:hypothetical protein